MHIGNLLKIAIKALGNNKLRAFLTMLGIIIGVASVITMLAIGQGSKRSIQAEISEMGSNMIMVHPGGDMRGGVRLEADDMESLTLADLEAIRTETRYVSYVSPSVNSAGQAVYGARNTPTTVYGVSADYLDIRRYRVADGDFFTEQDIRAAAKVCVVGRTVVDELFPDGEAPWAHRALRHHPAAHRGRARKQGLQQHGHGPGRPHPRPLHHGAEARPGHHAPAGNHLLGPERGLHRPGHRRNHRPCCAATTSCARGRTTTSPSTRSRN